MPKINSMNNFKKILTYAALGLFILTFFMGFIADIIDLVDLGDIPSSSLKTFLVWMTIIDLLASIVICIVASVGIYKYVSDYGAEDHENFLIAPVFVFAIASHLIEGITISYFKSHGGATLTDIGIVMLVFCILGFVACFVALCITNSLAKKVLGVLGFIFTFVYVIISLTQSGSALSTFSIVVMVFFILSIFASAAALLIPDTGAYGYGYADYSPSLPSTTSELDTSSNKTNNDNDGSDPYEQLLKLKKLYDQKIISKSEYEEKKKKYTDRL